MEISIRSGWKEADSNLPCPVRRDSSSSEAESASSLPSRTDALAAAGVLGSLPDLSEKFRVGPTVETLDRTGVSEGKRQ